MFTAFKRKANLPDFFERGTDLQATGSFYDSLAFNHFSQQDQQNLLRISQYMKEVDPSLEQFLLRNLDEIAPNAGHSISMQQMKTYLQNFFHANRNDDYVQELVAFFTLLREQRFKLGKLVVVWNQLSFYLISHVLHKQTASNDFFKTISSAINIELELLADVFAENSLEEVITEVTTLTKAHGRIMHMKDLVISLNKQTDEIASSSSAIEELTSSIAEVASASTNIAEKSSESVSNATEGKQAIEHALQEIFTTEETFMDIAEGFTNLQNHIDDIEQVVTLIKQIADQTNLLALNASIEAARAGEYGKGFEVVAQEVRKLAEGTVSALEKVSHNVHTLKSYSTSFSLSMKETKKTIQEATAEAKQSLPLLTSIVKAIESIDADITNTAAISQQQAASLDEMSGRISDIATIQKDIQNFSDKTSQDIYDLGKELIRFRSELAAGDHVKLSTISLLQLSKADHILWTWRIYNMFLGLEHVQPSDVNSHKECRLGKWYLDEQTQHRLGSHPSFIELDYCHEQVHVFAKQAVEAYNQGNIQHADTCLQEINQASQKVQNDIDELIAFILEERKFMKK